MKPKRTPRSDGVLREHQPKTRKFVGAVPATKKGTGTIREVVGWSRTLDEYSTSLDKMVELALISELDETTVLSFRRQAQSMLPPDIAEKYNGYLDFIVEARMGIKAGRQPPTPPQPRPERPTHPAALFAEDELNREAGFPIRPRKPLDPESRPE